MVHRHFVMIYKRLALSTTKIAELTKTKLIPWSFRPVIMTIEGDGLYECDFVLATLTDQNSTQYSELVKAASCGGGHTSQHY